MTNFSTNGPKTIEELYALLEKKVKQPVGSCGIQLEYQKFTREEVGKMIPEPKYQRLLSVSTLKKQGQLNWTLLLPMVIAIRPDSVPEASRGARIIDGQHKGFKFFASQVDDTPYTCCVINHPEGSTLEECEKKEAQIFTALNTQRKKLSKLEEIRAGVVWDEPAALWMQTILLTLNLVVDDTFGSENDDAMEVKGFYQTWFISDDMRTEKHLPTIIGGYNLWKACYGDSAKYVNGTALRSMVLINEFLQTLRNGKRREFEKYLIHIMPMTTSQDRLVKAYTDRKANQYVLHSIIDMYSAYCEAQNIDKNFRIGAETIANAVSVNSKFRNPNQD